MVQAIWQTVIGLSQKQYAVYYIDIAITNVVGGMYEKIRDRLFSYICPVIM